MAQPAISEQTARALSHIYSDAEARLAREIADTLGGSQTVPEARLRALLALVGEQMDALEEASRSWLSDDLRFVYSAGGESAAAAVGSDFAWTQLHVEAIQALAGRTWTDVLAATRFVRRDTKAIIRRLAADAAARTVLGEVTASRSGADLARLVQRATGATTLRYSDGSRHGIRDWGDMNARTTSAQAFNSGTVTQAREDRFDWMEVFDGADCGWVSHDDTDLANGTVRSLAECEAHSLSHPRCVLPDTRITLYGDVIEMVRARYSGRSIHLTVATPSGLNDLAVGPHHPVLTRRGWKPAHLIGEGDDLVYDSWHDHPRDEVVERQLKEMPTAADLFESLRSVGSCTLATAASDDLHGDAEFCEREIEVVRPAGELLLIGHPGSVEEPRQRHFVRPDDRAPTAVTQVRRSDPFIAAVPTPPSGFMGGCGDVSPTPGARLRIELRPQELLGLGDGAADSHLPEPLADRRSRDTGQAGDLLTVEALIDVEAAEFVRAQRVMASARAVDALAVRTVAGDLHGRSTSSALAPGIVGPAGVGHRFVLVPVIAVRRGWHDGFVYDLTSSAGRFGGWGCTMKNCARSFSPSPDVDSARGAQSARRFTDAEQQAAADAERARAATTLVTGEPVGRFSAGRAARQSRQPRTPRQSRV